MGWFGARSKVLQYILAQEALPHLVPTSVAAKKKPYVWVSVFSLLETRDNLLRFGVEADIKLYKIRIQKAPFGLLKLG